MIDTLTLFQLFSQSNMFKTLYPSYFNFLSIFKEYELSIIIILKR